MPRVESTVTIDAPITQVFTLSQSQGELRYRWDPFVRSQELLDGADVPDKGVRTLTRSRHGLRMVSEYQSYRPPSQVGMKMVEGPWFFENFAGGWSFKPDGEERTTATWRYVFSCRPAWLRPVAHRIGTWYLGRDIDRRLAAFAAAFGDPEVRAALADE
ncbi:MAG: SRPBCC family protein [Acidimicrobiales bacterium]|nr:SRPBCC family protein [Acidimicrobiales bacterium]